jgi:hypothetical protein
LQQALHPFPTFNGDESHVNISLKAGGAVVALEKASWLELAKKNNAFLRKDGSCFPDEIAPLRLR